MRPHNCFTKLRQEAILALRLTISLAFLAVGPSMAFGQTNFGPVKLGSSSVATVPVTILSDYPVTSIQVLTQGAPNLDFTNAGGGTCAVGTAYSYSATCTVAVKFAPQQAGARYGAVVVATANGSDVTASTTAYFQGSGGIVTGPKAVFMPGAQSNIGSGFVAPQGVAVDNSGNVFVADSGNTAVYKETLTNGTYAQTTIGSGFSDPRGVAVDGLGNVYIADAGRGVVFKETLSSGQYSQSEISGFVKPTGLAVDGGGNLFVSDQGGSGISPTLYEETLVNGQYILSTIAQGFTTPQGVAVDGAGNLYVADQYGQTLYKESLSSGVYTQSKFLSIAQPTGVAVDGNGNVYVAEYGGGSFLVEFPSSGSYVQEAYGSYAAAPFSVAVDGSGNLYTLSQGLDCCGSDYPPAVSKFTAALPPTLNFGPASPDSQSVDASNFQTAIVANFGSAALNFSGVAYPTDFPESSGIATDCKSGSSVSIGAFCTLSIKFAPQEQLGSTPSNIFNEDVTVTTNTGNTSGTESKIAVTGTEVHTASMTIVPSSNPAAPGSTVTFTATLADADGPTSLTPTGTVEFFIDSQGSAASLVTLTNGVATYTTSTLTTGTHTIQGYYSGDSDFLNFYSSKINETIAVPPPISPFGDTTIGNVNVGTTSSPITLTITFNASETLNGISVVTEGAPNLDFTNAGGGTCATGITYTSGNTCTIKVAFAPKYPGTRNGAVILTGATGVLATGYLQGTGVAPQATFLPGVVSTVATGFIHFASGDVNVAVDGSGNVFITAPNSAGSAYGSVYKESLSVGSYTQSTVLSSLPGPDSIAIDGSGTLYLGSGCTLDKESPEGDNFLQSQIGSICGNYGVAIDGSGNAYLAAGQFGVFVYTLSNGQYTQSALGTGLVYPTGVAVDGAGNVYIADYDYNANTVNLYKETPSNGTYTQSKLAHGLQVYTGIAVDNVGNLYVVADNYPASPTLVKLTLTGTGFTQTQIGSSQTWQNPISIAVDSAGNVYVANSTEVNGGEATVYKIDLADPPSLSFATTGAGSTSSDSPQTVTLANNGNATLTFPIPGSGADPKITGDFTLNSSGSSACPLVTSTSSTPGTLASGASCQLPISFAPLAIGNLTGALVLADNSLNATNATQTISLSGTATSVETTSTLESSLTSSVYGQPVTFTATVNPGTGTAIPSGTVQFSVDNSVAGSPIALSSGVAQYTTSLLKSGTHTINATYSPAAGSGFLASTATALNQVVGKATPAVSVTPSSLNFARTQPLVVTILVSNASGGGTTPTGSVTLTGPGYNSGPVSLSDGSAVIDIPSGSLATGSDAFVASYAPDATSAPNYNSASESTTVTVSSSPVSLRFVPVAPCRIADTRNPTGPFGGPELAAGTFREFDVPQSACGIPTTAVAYSLNVTVVPTASLNYLTLWPSGETQPLVSTLNSDGRIKANAAIAPAGVNGGVNVYVSDSTNVILDIDGYFVPPGTAASLEFYPLTPCRVADTRGASGSLGGPSLTAGASRAFPIQSSACNIPSTAEAYSLNVTAVPHKTLNYLTTWNTGGAQPNVSTLNAPTGAVTANAAIVPAGSGGDISIFVSDAADVILDINGYFAPPTSGGLSLYTVAPCRIIDTRNGPGAFNGVLPVNAEASACAPPSSAQAYVLNATVVPSGSLNYLTLWPNGETQPNVSTLNAGDGAVTSNMAIVPTTNGSIDAFSSNPTNLILDISSYFAP